MPENVSKEVEAVRYIGNFAAHPIKSERSGEIVEVDEDEATWSLEIVTNLLRYVFIDRPERDQRVAALEAKLQETRRNSKKPI